MGEVQGLIQRQLQQLLRLLLKNRLQPLLQKILLHLHLLLLLHLLMILHLLNLLQRNLKHLTPALNPIYLASLTEGKTSAKFSTENSLLKIYLIKLYEC